MVSIETVYQKGKSRTELLNIPVSAASMSWVDKKMHPQPSMADNMAEALRMYEENERWIHSKDYQIMQRPYEERFAQIFHSVRETVLTDTYGPSTSHYDRAVAIIQRGVMGLWCSTRSDRQGQWNRVVESVAKQAVDTYAERYTHWSTHVHRKAASTIRPSASGTVAAVTICSSGEGPSVSRRRQDLGTTWTRSKKIQVPATTG